MNAMCFCTRVRIELNVALLPVFVFPNLRSEVDCIRDVTEAYLNRTVLGRDMVSAC